jgi:hypothetical protein
LRFAEKVEPQGEDAGEGADEDNDGDSERDPGAERMSNRRATHRQIIAPDGDEPAGRAPDRDRQATE